MALLIAVSRAILEELFGMPAGEIMRLDINIEPPFYCDYVMRHQSYAMLAADTARRATTYASLGHSTRIGAVIYSIALRSVCQQ